jgi:hypothetical protein
LEQSSAKRSFLIALVASMCATAALAIGILLFSEFDETSARILGSTAALSFFSLLALPAGALLDRRRMLPLAWASLAVTALALVLVLVLLWVDWDDLADWLWKSALTLTVFAIALAQAAATSGRVRPGDARAVRRLYAGAVALAAAVATMAAVATWAEIESDGYYRLLGALAVATLLATLLQPVVRRIEGGPDPQGRLGAHRLCVTLADGRSLVEETRGRDFADAVARAVRAAEKQGSQVSKIERFGRG